jgi:ATP-dependent 26S proteasome regulatory subunit
MTVRSKLKYFERNLLQCQFIVIFYGLLFSGAEIRSVCTEAGMFAIRARRKVATEKDFLEAVNKVIKSYAKFSATPRYMTYN